jgi:hypothetical protein
VSYLDKYSRRLGRSGDNVGDVYQENTINFINENFSSSPTFRRLQVDSLTHIEITEIDARVVEVERLGTLREVILRPMETLEIGMNVLIDDEWYMLIDKYGGNASTSLKMLALKINQRLRWVDKDGVKHDIKCIVSATDLGSKSKQSKNDIEWNKYDVRLPMGQMFLTFESNDLTRNFNLNFRFIFNSKVYEIVGIDDITNIDSNSNGLIQCTLKITTENTQDDFVNGYAHNNYDTDDTDIITETEGGLW